MTSDARNPSFLKSKLFWALVASPVMALIALVGVWFLGQLSLEKQLAALRAQGLPTTEYELNNFYAVPEGTADTTDLWVEAMDAVEFAGLSVRADGLPFLGHGPTPVPAPGEPWAELEASRTLLGELESEFQAIRTAAEAEGNVRFPGDFSLGVGPWQSHSTNSSDVLRLLQLDAHVSAHDGNHSQVLEDLRAIFALSDVIRDEPTLISQYMANAIHHVGCGAVVGFMPHCNWSDTELESLQTAIRSADFRHGVVNVLRGERAICLTELDRQSLGPLRFWNKRESLPLFERAIDGISISWPEALSRQHELAAPVVTDEISGFDRLTFGGVLPALWSVERAASVGARADAMQKCTVAAIAAERFRLKHGRLPDSLAEIGQEFLGASEEPLNLMDPFDGQPLRFKSEKTRIIIYSIGDNEQDDGGDYDDAEPPPPLDIGFLVKK